MDQPHHHLFLSSMEILCQEFQVIHHLMNPYLSALKEQTVKYKIHQVGASNRSQFAKPNIEKKTNSINVTNIHATSLL